MAYHLKHGPMKNELIGELASYYKALGFRKFKIAGGSIGFEKHLEGMRVLTIYTSNSYGMSGGEYKITFKAVEDILKEIKHPEFIEEDNLPITIRDRITHPIEQNNGKYFFHIESFSVEESEDLESFVFKYEEYVNKIIYYINNEGADFIEHYSYLPNVLAEMDKLKSEGRSWSEILEGGGGHLFKGLIISKLCNDSNYEHKVELVGKICHEIKVNTEEWLSYYEKYKLHLESLEPIYNI